MIFIFMSPPPRPHQVAKNSAHAQPVHQAQAQACELAAIIDAAAAVDGAAV
jgi:hypothetical protein